MLTFVLELEAVLLVATTGELLLIEAGSREVEEVGLAQTGD